MKEVEVTLKGKKVKLHIGEITFGKEMELLKKYSVIDVRTGNVKSLNVFGYIEELIVASIVKVEPEMEITLEDIRSLSRDDGKKLMNVVLEVNPFRY